MFAGTEITIGDEKFVVPPISLGQLRNGVLAKLKEHDELIAKGDFFDAMNLRGEVILKALQRNYPNFAEAKLLEHLDMANTTPLWLSILGASGFTAGETQAVTNKTDGT